LKIGFDLGAQPWDFMGTPTWLITHTHLDHIAALPVYVARRRMMRMEPPTLYLPAEAVEDVRRLLLIMQRLDRGRMICQLNGIKAGDEIELSRELIITPFATTHTIPSLGYVVWDRRLKLKEEYHGLPARRYAICGWAAPRSRARCARRWSPTPVILALRDWTTSPRCMTPKS